MFISNKSNVVLIRPCILSILFAVVEIILVPFFFSSQQPANQRAIFGDKARSAAPTSNIRFGSTAGVQKPDGPGFPSFLQTFYYLFTFFSFCVAFSDIFLSFFLFPLNFLFFYIRFLLFYPFSFLSFLF